MSPRPQPADGAPARGEHRTRPSVLASARQTSVAGLAFVVGLAVLASCAAVPADDTEAAAPALAHLAAPEHYALLLEDEVVRVTEFTLEPGQSDAWHRHPHEAFYVLEGGTIRIHLPGGESIEASFDAGAVTSHGPWSHRVENVGATRFRAVIFEVRGAE